MGKEIPNHSMHLQPVVFLNQLSRHSSHDAFAEIKRDIKPKVVRSGHRVQQHTGFGGGSRA